jgi:hypothetical protein
MRIQFWCFDGEVSEGMLSYFIVVIYNIYIYNLINIKLEFK